MDTVLFIRLAAAVLAAGALGTIIYRRKKA
jgi:hypothetical protein